MIRYFIIAVITLQITAVGLAQQTIEAYKIIPLAGRSSTQGRVDGVGEDARFQGITALWGDGTNLYVADGFSIRHVELSTARVTTLSFTAGTGLIRANGASGFAYSYSGLYGLWGDGTWLYATDIGEGSIRRIDLKSGGVQTFSSDLGFAWGLAGQGSALYVASAQNGRILRVDVSSGYASSFANTGAGTPYTCRLGSGCIGYFPPGPTRMWSDGQSLYVSGYSGDVKRVDLATGLQTSLPSVPFNVGALTGGHGQLFVASISGSGLGALDLATGEYTPLLQPELQNATALWCDGTNLYVAQNNVIRSLNLATGMTRNIAGLSATSEAQFANGVGAAARFDHPSAMWTQGDDLYVSDSGNSTLRKVRISTNDVGLLAGTPVAASSTNRELRDGIGASAAFQGPGALWGDGAALYLTDSNSIRRVDLSTTEVKTIAGGLTAGARNGFGLEAQFNSPSGLWAIDGNLYIADYNNEVIRRMDITTQEVTTLAGAFRSSGTTDGTFENARFQGPSSIWGIGRTLYVADINSIRTISLDSGTVDTLIRKPSTRIGALWGRGNFLYYGISNDPLGSTPAYLTKLDLNSVEITKVLHGMNDLLTGSAIIISGGISGSGGDLLLSAPSEGILYRLEPDSLPTLTKLNLTNPGISSQVTSGGPAGVSVGYARITETSGNSTPAGFAIFALRQNGILISEASVPAGHTIRSGRFSASAGGGVNTGIAIANPNSESASVSFYFTDQSGHDYGYGGFILGGNTQTARFLTEIPFNATTTFDGTFTFVSTLPISATALRGYLNERSEFLMTTLPVVDLSVQSSASVIVPHIAQGGGWTTDLVLVNPSDQPISGALQLIGITQTSLPSTYSLPAHASQRLRFQGGVQTSSGAVRVIPQSGVAPSAVCIFSFVQNAVRVTEAGVPDVPVASAFRMYSQRGSSANGTPVIRSGLAIVNTGSTPVDVTIELTDPNGQMSRGNTLPTPLVGKTTLQIPAMSQIAIFEDELFPYFPDGSRLMRVSTPFPAVSVIGIRGRYNERGEFLITTTPAIPEDTNPDTRPLYIPHFVDGGGYTTQFVLFSGTAQSRTTSLSVTTESFNQNGQPVVLSPQ